MVQGIITVILTALLSASVSQEPAMRKFIERQGTHWDEIECDFDARTPDRPHNARGNKRGYYSGALMGNGLIGTNLYKLKDNVYRLNIGRSDITEQREPYNVFNRGRLPIGYFTLSTVGKVTSESMDLNIYDAVTSGTFTTDKGKIDFKTYVHSLKDIVIFETRTKGEEKDYKWEFVPFMAISPRVFSGKAIPEGFTNSEGKTNPDAYRIERNGIEFLIQPIASDTTLTNIKKYYAVAWKQESNGNRRRITATVSFEDSEEKAIGNAGRVLESKASFKSHTAWWHDFYENVAFLTFPDPLFERFYWMQYYKFASTAREGKPIVDLQGVWPTWDTPWPAIWMNLNIQLTYSFLTKANMGEFAQPLWDTLWEHRDNLVRNVTDIPGQEGWTDSACLGRTCSYDLHSPLNPSNAQHNSYEVGNLAWTLFYWYQQCKAYGDDKAMKERLFPLLKSSIGLFFHIRNTLEDGTYSLPSTASPEYPVSVSGPNTNYDLANLRQALMELIEIDEKFGINDPALPSWKDFLAKMPPFQYDEETGFKISETTEFLFTDHRHYSHLFMIYPYHILDWNNPRERKMAELSIDRWQGNQGYSRTGKAAMLSSEGRGDEALEQMTYFVENFLTPNTLYAEGGPVIETPLAAASTLHEFYLQDWGDRLRIFHGCPSEWKNVIFKKMRANGAFLVNAVRENGHTKTVEVFSEKGNPCRVQTDIPESSLSVTNQKGNKVGFRAIDCPELEGKGSLIEFGTKKGETIIITKNSRAK